MVPRDKGVITTAGECGQRGGNWAPVICAPKAHELILQGQEASEVKMLSSKPHFQETYKLELSVPASRSKCLAVSS